MALDRKQTDIGRSVEIACKRLSQRALMVLEKALDEARTPELEYRWRIAAAKEILDRAWGRPKQTIDANVNIEGSEALITAINAGKERARNTPNPSVELH